MALSDVNSEDADALRGRLSGAGLHFKQGSPQVPLEIDDQLPKRVGGYGTLELLSVRGWRFGIVAAVGGGVLVMGTHDLPGPEGEQYEIKATAASVEEAAPLIWRQALQLGLPPVSGFLGIEKRRFAA